MFTVILALTLAADVDPEPPGVQVKVIAATDWSKVVGAGRMDKHAVARSPGELIRFFRFAFRDRKEAEETTAANLRAALNVKEMDWDKQMILVVAAGAHGGGTTVEVKALKRWGKTLTVSWKLNDSGKGGDVKTHPATAILLPVYKGKVVFEQVK